MVVLGYQSLLSCVRRTLLWGERSCGAMLSFHMVGRFLWYIRRRVANRNGFPFPSQEHAAPAALVARRKTFNNAQRGCPHVCLRPGDDAVGGGVRLAFGCADFWSLGLLVFRIALFDVPTHLLVVCFRLSAVLLVVLACSAHLDKPKAVIMS